MARRHLPWFLFWGYAAIAPWLAVAVWSLPVATAAGAMLTPLAALLALAVGYRMGVAGQIIWSPLFSVLGLVLTANAMMVLVQLAWLPASMTSVVAQWDQASRINAGVLVFGRPTGLYANPNELALIGMVAALVALFVPEVGRARTRALCGGLGIMLVLSSGSRGYLLAIAAALVFFVHRVFASRKRQSNRFMPVVVGGLLGAGLLTGAAWSSTLDGLRSQSRIETVSSDDSVRGRWEQAEGVLDLTLDYPFGVLEPPQRSAKFSLDSEYTRALVQGGPWMLAILLWGIIATVHTASATRTSYRTAQMGIAVSVSVAALSQLPLSSPGGVWLFLILGTMAGRGATALWADDIQALDMPSSRSGY